MAKHDDKWLTRFVRWAHKPSPTGEWVYRGQAAKYQAIVPSLMRPGLREHHASRELFDIDYDVAQAIFSASPTFGEGALHPVISDTMGSQIEGLAAMMGSAPSIHPEVSFAELARALAQHYDYPTFFVDVSFHPLVSAMFASHKFGADGYRVSDDAGVLYRWPVERKSARRCNIHGTIRGELFELGVIDIRNVHPMVRRPNTQYAALATPVFDPKPIYQPFQTSIDQLECVDMGALECCDRFVLPPRAAQTLSEQTGVTIAGLFPDCIDLGFSYLAVIALLSLTIHHPKETDGKVAELLEAMFDRTVSAARALLDRECFRLDPEVEVTSHARLYSLVDLRSSVHLQVETARRAVADMNTPGGARRAHNQIEKKRARLQKIANERFTGWKEAVHSVLGDEAAENLGESPQYTITRGNNDWVLGEIDRRLHRVDPILKTADWLPIWALDNAMGEDLRGVLNSNQEYETTMRGQQHINQATIQALERFGHFKPQC